MLRLVHQHGKASGRVDENFPCCYSFPLIPSVFAALSLPMVGWLVASGLRNSLHTRKFSSLQREKFSLCTLHDLMVGWLRITHHIQSGPRRENSHPVPRNRQPHHMWGTETPTQMLSHESNPGHRCRSPNACLCDNHSPQYNLNLNQN